jgi:tRNA(Ile)-lysidine synthase
MLFERVERSIVERRLLAAGDRGLCAFSGGPDSLCLLHLLVQLRERWRLELVAVHVDHGLRPESADEARRAVRQAEALGVEAIACRVHVEAGPGRNLQESARLARKAALEEEARRRSAAWVALGHTAQDQAETVLMRAVRGAGPAGLAGMAWRRGLFVRPLLGLTRAEVLAYLGAHDLRALEDPSNATPRFLRNRLRREVLPLLERENPEVLAALGRLAETCREEDEALEAMAGSELERAAGSDGEVVLAGLVTLPAGLLHRVLRLLFARATGSARRLGRAHVLALAALARGTEGTALLDLPGARAERRYGRLRLRCGQPDDAPMREVSVAGPGSVQLEDGRVLELTLAGAGSATAEAPPDLRRSAPPLPGLRLNAGRVRFPLILRGPHPGDRIRLDDHRTRKVARLLLDAKIPRRERSRVPLLMSGGEVLVVLGVRCASGVDAAPDTREAVLLLRWHGNDGVSLLASRR